jgi:hypothetical protein
MAKTNAKHVMLTPKQMPLNIKTTCSKNVLSIRLPPLSYMD